MNTGNNSTNTHIRLECRAEGASFFFFFWGNRDKRLTARVYVVRQCQFCHYVSTCRVFNKLLLVYSSPLYLPNKREFERYTGKINISPEAEDTSVQKRLIEKPIMTCSIMDEQYSAIKGQTLISLSVLIKLLLDVVMEKASHMHLT